MSTRWLLLTILMLSGCATDVQLREAQLDERAAIGHEFRRIRSQLNEIERRLYRVETDSNRINSTFNKLGIQGSGGNYYIAPKVQSLEPVR